LTYIFAVLFHLDTIWVKFDGQGHRSKFKVTGWNNSKKHCFVQSVRWVCTLLAASGERDWTTTEMFFA